MHPHQPKHTKSPHKPQTANPTHYLLIEIIKVLLAGLIISSRRHSRGPLLHRRRVWRLVHVRQQHSLREEGFVVLARAAVAVTTCSNFEVEGTVYPATATAHSQQSHPLHTAHHTPHPSSTSTFAPPPRGPISSSSSSGARRYGTGINEVRYASWDARILEDTAGLFRIQVRHIRYLMHIYGGRFAALVSELLVVW